MKKTLVFSLILALLFVTGCNSGQNPEVRETKAEPSSAVATTAEKEAPAEDAVKVARTAISSELDNINPWLSAAADTKAVMGNVFEGLLSYDETGKLIPALAESWQVSEDGLSYTFNLREGVTYHNGDQFDAADVVYSIETLAGLTGSDPLSSRFNNVKSVEAVDQKTVKINLNERNAAFLAACIEVILPVGYEQQDSKPVGTGPFMFESYEPGQKVVLTKNENYWNPDRIAQIDKAEFYIITDPTAVVNGLKSGQIDFADIDPKNVALVEQDFNILASPQNMVQLMALNSERKPFGDIRVRQAINYAVNKDELIAAVANGYGSKIETNMSPIMAEYYNTAIAAHSQDIEKAKALLAEAGYKDGFSTSITVPSNYKFHVDTAQVIANQLLQIGVKAEIKQVEWGVWLDEVYKQFNYDMTIIGLAGKLDPHQVLVRYQSDYKRNFMRFSNADYDAKIAEAIVEIDPVKRAQLYRECQALLADNAAAVYIMDPNLVVAMRKDMTGFKFYPLRFLDMTSIKFE